jgi:hyperosmotically inducible protein
MRALYLLIPLVGLTLGSCGNSDSRPSNTAAKYDADNTGKNVRDRNNHLPTPGNQSESEASLAVTQKIRQALMKDDSLSTNAKNVKVITDEAGRVTLRGPVNSDNEKRAVGTIAKNVAGVRGLDNQLEVIIIE